MTFVSNPLPLRRATGALGLAAALSAATLPVQAATVLLPGAACMSDGPVKVLSTGELLNVTAHKSSGDDRTMFTCPVPMGATPVTISTATLELRLRLNNNPNSSSGDPGFRCALVTVRSDGVIHEAPGIVLPTATYAGSTLYFTPSIPAKLPGAALLGAVLVRCAVPNVLSGEAAGIVNMRITY